jgi:hypothetical protein
MHSPSKGTDFAGKSGNTKIPPTASPTQLQLVQQTVGWDLPSPGSALPPEADVTFATLEIR